MFICACSSFGIVDGKQTLMVEKNAAIAQMDEEYNEKVEIYNQLVAQKAEKERKAEMNLLREENLGEGTDIMIADNSDQNKYIADLSRKVVKKI